MFKIFYFPHRNVWLVQVTPFATLQGQTSLLHAPLESKLTAHALGSCHTDGQVSFRKLKGSLLCGLMYSNHLITVKLHFHVQKFYNLHVES
jgi:hypothetical protein